MAIENDGKRCPVCMKGTLHQGLREETYTHQGVVLHFEQPGAYCDHCDEGIISGVEAQPITEKISQFRKEVDRKIGQELRKNRERLGLTQTEASQIAGGGVNAFSRYETGKVPAPIAVINLFTLLADDPEALDKLKKISSTDEIKSA